MTYKASLDGLAKGVTIFITISFVLVIAALFPVSTVTTNLAPFITILFLVASYAVAFAFRIIDYKISDQKLTIHRLIGDVHIQFSKIKSVELIPKEKTGWAIRIFGVSGLFGYYGKFTNRQLGPMTWYATRRSRYVLVTTVQNKKIILTPDEPELFVADFNTSLKV